MKCKKREIFRKLHKLYLINAASHPIIKFVSKLAISE